MNGNFVPVVGAAAVIGMGLMLILLVTLRPWADTDGGYDTHLNFREGVPEDYSRTELSWIGQDAAETLGWGPGDSAHERDPAESLFVGKACASCHGFDGRGGVVGEDLSEVTRSDVRKTLKKGPGGMPSFSSLGTEEIDLLAAWLVGKQPVDSSDSDGEPQPAPISVVPTPRPTAVPTATSVPPETGPSPTPSTVKQPEASSSPGPAATPAAEPTASSVPDVPEPRGPVALRASTATIEIDGDTADWAEIPATSLLLQQIRRLPGSDMGDIGPITAFLRVAVDDQRIYVLLEVEDDFDYVPDDHGQSAATAVMFRIDDPAAPHMGTTEEDQKRSLGKVDIWHWELDCGAGTVSGGASGISGGNDPDCNLDDEWSTTPAEREDDGSPQAENSIAGGWDHTARSAGTGAAGTWIFEMSRKLQTGDPDDAQLVAGGTAVIALAYWDADETADGWTDAGHIQSSSGGWIEVTLP